MIHQDYHTCMLYIFLHAVILIGFNTNSTSLSSSESNGIVALVVSVFNMTIGEGNTVQVRITTADNSAHGRKEFTVL